MKNRIQSLAVSQGTLALIYVIFGAVLLIRPGLTSAIIGYAAGICLLLYGIIKIAGYLRSRDASGFFKLDLFAGIVLSAVGLFTLLQPKIILSILPIALGIAILIDGVSKAQRAFGLKKLAYRYWWIAMVFSILTAALGILLIINPFDAAELMIRILGLSLIIDGASDLWSLYCLSKQQKLT